MEHPFEDSFPAFACFISVVATGSSEGNVVMPTAQMVNSMTQLHEAAVRLDAPRSCWPSQVSNKICTHGTL